MRLGFDPRVGKIPWRRRARQPTPVFMSKPAPVFMSKPAPVFMSKPTPVFMSKPTPVFMSGESHGQRDLEGYSPRGRQESDVTEQLTLGSSVCVCVCVCVRARVFSCVRHFASLYDSGLLHRGGQLCTSCGRSGGHTLMNLSSSRYQNQQRWCPQGSRPIAKCMMCKQDCRVQVSCESLCIRSREKHFGCVSEKDGHVHSL